MQRQTRVRSCNKSGMCQRAQVMVYIEPNVPKATLKHCAKEAVSICIKTVSFLSPVRNQNITKNKQTKKLTDLRILQRVKMICYLFMYSFICLFILKQGYNSACLWQYLQTNCSHPPEDKLNYQQLPIVNVHQLPRTFQCSARVSHKELKP